MQNKIRLTVGGIEYMVLSDEDEAFVRRLGEDLDEKLEEIRRGNRRLSTTMVAIMAALDYSEQLAKSRAECGELRRRLENAERAGACERLNGEEARREIERLSEELCRLRQQESAGCP